jgi:hypothetical protein
VALENYGRRNRFRGLRLLEDKLRPQYLVRVDFIWSERKHPMYYAVEDVRSRCVEVEATLPRGHSTNIQRRYSRPCASSSTIKDSNRNTLKQQYRYRYCALHDIFAAPGMNFLLSHTALALMRLRERHCTPVPTCHISDCFEVIPGAQKTLFNI